MSSRSWYWLLPFILLVGCSPSPKAQAGGPPAKPMEQAATEPTSSALPPTTTMTPTSTATPTPLIPTPLPTIEPTVPVWPGPLTYGHPPTPSAPVPSPAAQIPFPPDATNILLLGSDRRPGSSFRTDTILVLSIQPSARGAALVSIPRDLFVYLPGITMQRINAAVGYGNLFSYPGGGWSLLYDTILYNLGIPIHYHAMVEMDGFRQIVDTLEGIQVNVACSYTDWRLKNPNWDPRNEDNWEMFTVSPGVVDMDGDYALWYARARKHSSDFDRSRRQQEVLRSIYRRILSLSLIPKIPQLYEDLSEAVETNLSLGDMLMLAIQAPRINISNLRSRFIGSKHGTPWTTPWGARVFLPDAGIIRDVLDEAFDFSSPDPRNSRPEIKVEVMNGSSRSDYAALAVERLEYAGFEAYESDNDHPFTSDSYVIDYGQAGAEDTQNLLSSLGLSSGDAQFLPNPSAPSAFRVVIGQDYSPCFKPNS